MLFNAEDSFYYYTHVSNAYKGCLNDSAEGLLLLLLMLLLLYNKYGTFLVIISVRNNN